MVTSISAAAIIDAEDVTPFKPATVMPRSKLTFQTDLDKYTEIELIGAGGSSRVYLVASSTGEKFAIKMLDPSRVTSSSFGNLLAMGSTLNEH